ncbi:AMP-binding protein [Pseudonocardia hispaniensis]|uniref:AMP-binding protein n=1 Tax=Pseudonocardia hispaniensis TaxID=904933 RepID=A0ABW1J4Q3_9PSEU
MRLSPSAHQDTFCRDHLPPPHRWPRLVFDLPELRYPDRLNCASALLDEPIDRFGADRPGVRGGDIAWTYGQLRQRANQVATVLTGELGLVPGNRVLLRGANSAWLAACWLGVLKAGGVAVTTMAMLRAGELTTIGELARPTIALCDARDLPDLLAADIPGLRPVPFGGDTADDLTVRCRTLGAGGGVFADVPTAADDVALLAFTSGTTGRPKATMHFHRDVLAIADTFARHVVRHRPDDVITGTPPLGFTYGLGGLLVFPLRAGASTVLLEHTTPDELADAVAAYGITALYTSPTMYRALLAAGRLDRLAGLRRCMSAGETLPAAVWTEFHERTGLRIIDGIGSTEMLHVFISAADDDIRPGATGRAVPGYRAAVVDDDGQPVPDGRPGHLVVQGPTGCRYLGGDRQGNYVRDGWNITGDTYIRDADGYFWYQARSDDMIISSGYNIAGPEVEQALVGHPDVVDCAVVGLPDEQRGMLVTAFVVLRAGVPGDEDEVHRLQDHVKQTIAPYKYPRAVRFVDRLPRTSTGKLQRFRLRQPGARPPADLARG